MTTSGATGHSDKTHASEKRDRSTLLICLLLAALVWAVFGQTIHFEFVNYDDPAYIYKNPAIIQGLSWPGIVWSFTHVNIGTWFPLTDVSHQLCWELFGNHAGGHHLVNVLLHTGAVIFLFLALQKMTKVRWPAAFAAALFAVHPLRVESVAWVVERKDVLSGLFFALALWAWSWRVELQTSASSHAASSDATSSAQYSPSGTRWYFLTLIFFALGLLSKSMLVTFPCVLLLLDFWPLRRCFQQTPATAPQSKFGWLHLNLISEKVPFFILSILVSAVTIISQKNAVAVAQQTSLVHRISNAVLAYFDYLKHTILPLNLTVIYPQPQAELSIPEVAWAIAILAGITGMAVLERKRQPWLFVGWLWYLGMLLPVIDIMQAGQNARADRFTYLPQIGLFLMLAWSATQLLNDAPWRRTILGTSATLVVFSCAWAAYFQTRHWENSVTLWTHACECTVHNSSAENSLGSALNNLGEWDQARLHFKRALEFKPDFAEAEVNLGVASLNLGQKSDAIRCFQQALQINPHSPDAHYHLGDMLTDEGDVTNAINHFEQALQVRPGYGEAEYDLGLALARLGKWDEAIQHYDEAMHFQIDAPTARYLTGAACAAKHQWSDASHFFNEAVQLKPDFAEAHYRLGLALDAQGQPEGARREFQNALSLATAQTNLALIKEIQSQK